MFINDFLYIIKWWSMFFAVGVIFLPLTWLIFKRFFGLGYALGKTLGVIILSYITFLLSIFSVAKFSLANLYLYILVSLGINLYILYKNKNEVIKDLKNNIPEIFIQELLFTSGLLLWSYVRAHQPEIRGLEKFMDYGFVTSALRSEILPPTDMWAAGNTINYYWFGHFVTAVLTKLSNIPSEITYNLMLATIMGLTLSSAFSISATLFKHISKNGIKKHFFIAGIISAIILTFAGNFHTPFYVLKNGSENYWYPDATRFIGYNPETEDKTIHEFPMYSFVVADLHGHLLNLPFVLLFVASSFVIVSQRKRGSFDNLNLILPGSLLGIMFMTSTWDFGNYTLALGYILLFSELQKNNFRLLKTAWDVGKTIIYILALGIIVALPFILKFESIAEGIRFVHTRTPIWQIAILWGFPALLTAIFIYTAKKLGKKNSTSDIFILSLLAASWTLIILPEIIFLKDIYIASHYRANTMFKLTYQAFVMSYLAGGYIIVRHITLQKDFYVKRFLSLFWVIVLFSILSYARISTNSYYGKLQNYVGLDGAKWMQTQYLDEYNIINWLKENAEKGDVLLEAPGDSYTDYNVISSYTGIPTISGWYVHEWLWRGTPDFPQERVNDITNIYEGSDVILTKSLLDKYKVKFIIVGNFERERFKVLNELKFSQLASPVFQTGTTTVYKVNNEV